MNEDMPRTGEASGADAKVRRRYHSLFWPIVLIGIGVVALMVNLNVIPLANLVTLFRFWPVLLIALGLEIMVARQRPWIGALIGLAVVAAMVGLALAAPALGIVTQPQVKTERFREPVGEATSAQVSLDIAEARTTIGALTDSNDLIDANLTHLGRIRFDVAGGREKTVSLVQESGSDAWFNWIDSSEAVHWQIGLTPNVPLELNLDGGSGSAEVDLADLELTAFRLDVASGRMNVSLPGGARSYSAQVEGGSGSLQLSVAERADAEIQVDGASGSIVVVVPDGAAVRVEVRDSGSGEVRVPSSFAQVERGDDDEGVWQSPEWDEAGRGINIVIEDVGSGSIEVR